MKAQAILDLMIKDHGRLISLLNKVEKSISKDSESAIKAFDAFEWAFEKHVFTEEKAIFTSYQPKNVSIGFKMLPELIKEHNEIINRLRVMRRDALIGHSSDFVGFKELLFRHKTFEEEELYPKMDQELSEADKQRIINRIQEMA
ncbi:MAG: hemerythrin domain-containing protein [Candidatus Thermoplasmatota archaeon]|nr:hemerythrin domain-containing protein [Candidatus Thermoplasmatota archaeon]MBU1941102.1 hemerythrin domain-containing protein [Candidatus Thermoplasmatota archaeon]